MARTSVAETIVELYGVLSTAGAPASGLSTAGVAQVYDHEPKPGDAIGPCWVTLSFAGSTPETWRIAMRVYSSVTESAKVGHDVLVAACEAIDARMVTASSMGPSEWDVSYLDDSACYVATDTLMIPRADLV